MLYVQISFSLFIISVICHIIVHKLLLKIRIITFKASFVFLLGFIINTNILSEYSKNSSSNELFFVSLVLYAVLAANYLLIVITPYLGYISPASKIILLLRQRALTSEEILSHFSNREEIDQRLDDLVNDGLIQKENVYYKTLNKGKVFLAIISVYRNTLKLKEAG